MIRSQPTPDLARRRGKVKVRAHPTLAVGSLALILWALVSKLGLVSPVILPSPVQVASAFANLLGHGDLLNDTALSFFRVTTGFVLAASLGVPIGFWAGISRRAASALLPLSELIRYMPVPALIPLVMVWFGVGEPAKVAIVFLGSFFQVVLMVAADVQRVPLEYRRVAQTLGATGWALIRRVIWPASLPALWDTGRLVLGWAWTYLVVAELVAANAGLGYRILKAQRFLNTDEMLAMVIWLGLLGLAMDQFLRHVHRRLFPWWEANR